MYIGYDDIVSRISSAPLWWLDGVPRYEPFSPQQVGVYVYEVALVHTECQRCRTRYDVAVQNSRYRPDLRSRIAYTNEVSVGDPPNACHSEGCLAGPTMNSMEIAVLQFWECHDTLRGWRRHPSWERPMVDAAWKGAEGSSPIFLQIYRSERKEEWSRALSAGDCPQMLAILESFGCERAAEVAHMLDLERREAEFAAQRIRLHSERFGKPENATKLL
jgi:hypothetical protein